MQDLGLSQTSHLWGFFVLVLGIIILPGLDMAYVLAQSLRGGRRAGFAAVGGIITGGMVHTLFAVVGVGVIVSSAPALFNAMLAAGAAYIGWMGYSLLRGASALGELQADTGGVRSGWAVFGQGLATCLINPKAYAFTLAVFPQFLRPEYGPIWTQALLIGLIVAAVQLAVYGPVALGAARLPGWLRVHPRAQIRAGRAVGLMLLLGALWTVWQGWVAFK